MRQITITVGSDGNIEIEKSGFKGKACEKVGIEIEKALGLVKITKKKPEYYQVETTSQKLGMS